MNYKTNIKIIIYTLSFIGCINTSYVTLTMDESEITDIVIIKNDNTIKYCGQNSNNNLVDAYKIPISDNLIIQHMTSRYNYIAIPLKNLTKHKNFIFNINYSGNIYGATASGKMFSLSETIKRNTVALVRQNNMESIYFTTKDGQFHVYHYNESTIFSSPYTYITLGILILIFYYFKMRS